MNPTKLYQRLKFDRRVDALRTPSLEALIDIAHDLGMGVELTIEIISGRINIERRFIEAQMSKWGRWTDHFGYADAFTLG